jgi:predicted metal-dependent TIM-barrel fold hydrolase
MKSKNSCLILLAGLLTSSPTFAQNEDIDLTGVIDMHVHAGPDSRPRAMNDWEAVQMAEAAGLRGVLLKNHFTMTADRAELAAQLVENLVVFGGIALNRSVGGINPEAVRQMAAFSGGRGKVVWLPTFDSQFFVTRAGTSDPFVSVMENGRPVEGLLEVFSTVVENNLVLAMGHSSPEEVLALIPLARAEGVENILITHVFGQDASFSQIQQMAATGAIMELDWLAAYTDPPLLDEYVEVIQSVGAESFIISSDFGQEGNPDHASGMRAFIAALKSREVSQRQIDVMAKENPAKLLGLDY